MVGQGAGDEGWGFTSRKRLPDNSSKNLGPLLIGWKRIIRQYPSFDSQQGTHTGLFHLRVFLPELVGEMETHDREARNVAFGVVLGK